MFFFVYYTIVISIYTVYYTVYIGDIKHRLTLLKLPTKAISHIMQYNSNKE